MLTDATLPHVLFALLLVSRLGDVLSTRLATPTLALEGNPIARWLGWRFVWATLLVALIAYYNTALAVMALVPSLMVTASNFSKVWLMRAMGERPYHDFLLKLARGARLGPALGLVAASAGALVLLGSTLCALENDVRYWGFWFGLGVISYGFAIGLHSTAFLVRLFHEARQTPAPGPASTT